MTKKKINLVCKPLPGSRIIRNKSDMLAEICKRYLSSFCTLTQNIQMYMIASLCVSKHGTHTFLAHFESNFKSSSWFV